MYGENRNYCSAYDKQTQEHEHTDDTGTPEHGWLWHSGYQLPMHRSRRQFTGIFGFRDVLQRQILRPVFCRLVAHPLENALVDVGAVLNQARAAKVKPDTALPLGRSLPRHGMEEKLRPEFAQPPEAVQ